MRVRLSDYSNVWRWDWWRFWNEWTLIKFTWKESKIVYVNLRFSIVQTEYWYVIENYLSKHWIYDKYIEL